MILTFMLLFTILIVAVAASSSCPMDLTYVKTIPWNASICNKDPVNKDLCCQELSSIFGIGLAEHLKETSMFYLPDLNTSSTCLSDFKHNLAAISVKPNIVSFCFPNPTQFVTNSSACAGITTLQDWNQKVAMDGPVKTSCKGDLKDQTLCSNCIDAALELVSNLKRTDPNANRCFYYTVLYVAAVANPFGTTDLSTTGCILGMTQPSNAGRKGSSNKRRKKIKLVITLLGVVVGVVFGFALALMVVYRKWDKRRKENVRRREVENEVRAGVLPGTGAKWLQISELERGTSKFSESNVIGKGGDGIVYKGALSDGTVVAVKEIFDLESKGDEEFCYEVGIISTIKHRNLLALRGCCVTSDSLKGKRRFLIYEFMPNGSLSDHLCCYGGNRLTWPERKNIILDVAKGLAYLHYEIKPPIYHRDIKATNILLDSKMHAKLADFGLAKQGNDGESHLTTGVAGTYGYVAPEYALYGQLSEKSDVYSFGIVILEIMSGRKVLDALNSSTDSVTDWVWALAESGKMEEIFDESIREGSVKNMVRFVHVGMLCAHLVVAFRPTIVEALKMLEGDIEIPELPERPVPLGHASFQSSLLHGLQRSG
ncbi:probable receptor-like protein kinase At1g11050 [Vigna unguiculata]|uniref:probable receptor-like protein kinase At1g11050 n=1 Tax=Vigna unguiculata TaxID=3917 RepID=UPI0010160B27|nr:probable receptor-like protein kinase At1g11050 [Vigna unguiculata]